MLCMRSKIIRMHSQKFQSDVRRIRYDIARKKVGDIFSAFPFRSEGGSKT